MPDDTCHWRLGTCCQARKRKTPQTWPSSAGYSALVQSAFL